MRARAVLPLLLLAACNSPVRDFPADRAPAPDRALIAARLAFGGTWIGPDLYVRSREGRTVQIRPSHETFLVAIPPGHYQIERYGEYLPRNDLVTFEAKPGKAIYIGDFLPRRDAAGEVMIAVHDGLEALDRDLRRRYLDRLPPIERGLVRSTLAPLDVGSGELVIAVRRRVPSAYGGVSTSVSFGAATTTTR
jgi:hypothetical protein